MAGQRRLHGDPRGLDVPDLADQDHVGVLAQDRPQPAGEGDAGLLVDLDLVDRGEGVLDRVLDRHDVAVGAVDLAERRVERGGLAAAGRAGADDHAVRRADQPSCSGRRCPAACRAARAGTAAGSCRAAASRPSRRRRPRWWRRGCRPRGPRPPCAIWPSCGRRRSTMFIPPRILIRLTSAGPIEPGQVEHVVQRAVDAVADPDPLALRLDVDVGGAVAQRLGDDHLDDLDDRRVLVDLRGLELRRPRGAGRRAPRTPGSGCRPRRVALYAVPSARSMARCVVTVGDAPGRPSAAPTAATCSGEGSTTATTTASSLDR